MAVKFQLTLPRVNWWGLWENPRFDISDDYPSRQLVSSSVEHHKRELNDCY